jgi:short-subunit dehydrogenase/acyl dehydratase
VLRCFDDFAVGDLAVLDRHFTREDFETFAALSGDRNPLHHDSAHAAATSFGVPIVPLHLVLAPLSAIAGMIFPGEPSLYLGHEVRATRPVHYGDHLRYSARVSAVAAASRTLTLRVLVLRGAEVVVEATMRVQATAERWERPAAAAILRTARPGRALITGASGEIGGAIAWTLARQGWALLLQDRGEGPRRDALRARLDGLGREVAFVSADLTEASGRAALARAAGAQADLELIVHAASPGLRATLEDLVAVNFAALRDLCAAALPGMLARQKGRVIGLGSTAMLRGLAGWEDYSAAKSMMAGFLSRLDGQQAGYGVRGLTLIPGFVATAFSETVRGDAPALLAQEVAEQVAAMATAPEPDPATVIEPGRLSPGRFGFQPMAAPVAAVASPQRDRMTAGNGAAPALDVGGIVRRVLRVAPSVSLAGGGLGQTPGWDSLAQIELILALERDLGLSFSATEMSSLTQFDEIERLCREKARTA